MAKVTRNCLVAALLGLLVACGGGGGGDRASGVEPGPAPPGGQQPPPPPVIPDPEAAPYAEQEVLLAFINEASIDADGHAVVDFQLTDEQGVGITDLAVDNVRFVLTKLQASPLGNATGTWQSYINSIETAGSVGPGTEDKLQATYERSGEFTNNGDGSYNYRFAQSVNAPPADILAQADAEGLDLSYEPERTHRVAIQFDGALGTANPHYDWVPATGATSGIPSMDIAATANCNRCHDPLAIHGGNRREIQYCVTCHNAGSTDANSGNTVDLKVMVHKIHMGANLPSVQAGGEYAIYGFRDSKHDYSMLHYPQDIRNCVNCHAGSGTGAGLEDVLQLTSQGDNWAHVPSGAACGSCHENAQGHIDRHEDTDCASCHSEGGFAGAIADSHRNLVQEKRGEFIASIEGVSNTLPGETPNVRFRISNPETGEDYDILSDPAFTEAGTRLAVGIAWDTGDYTNTGNGSDNASQVQANPLGADAGTVDNGDGSFSVPLPIAIPDGSEAPGIAASGSGVAIVEGHPVAELVLDDDVGPEYVEIPMTNAHRFFSIDEADGEASARREVVTIEQCQACHQSLSLHGGNRTDNIENCVSCHNPRNTDRDVRLVAADPPTDGKTEQSIDFKVMVHGIHAAALREKPLEVVGFRGFSTYRYTEESVHYPGDLSNCSTCHAGNSFTLPLADTVLATSIDTGADPADPADDTVMTPTAAVCSSCHDNQVAQAHMQSNGASFATTQAAIDSGEVIEECAVCHGEGRSADVATVHKPR